MTWWKKRPKSDDGSEDTGEMASAGVESGAEADAVKAGQPAAAAPPTTKYGPFSGTRPVHLIAVNYEHHPDGLGEDAEPLCVFCRPSNGLLGAFDGLGGAGGETIRRPDGSERTGAWLASRRVRQVVRNVYDELIPRMMMLSASGDSGAYEQFADAPAPRPPVDFTATLKDAIQEELVRYAAELGAGTGGRLKSRLIRTLPTTMALCQFDLDSNLLTAIWAGDSRVYYLRPDIGLQQVTTDDLKSNADALENLTQDSPMSNCISASTDFVLHERQLELHAHSILLAASDGCFGYVRTPLHFEYLLLRTMQQATDVRDWRDRLYAEIELVTSDDSTLSVAVIGWPDFVSCQRHFKARYQWCAERIGTYDAWHERVKLAERELGQAREALAAHTRDLWEEYRKTYEIPNMAPTRDVPDRRRDEAAPRPAAPEPEPEPVVVVDGPRDSGGGENADLPGGDGPR
jgi:serine/threonine protein phosphatase PrpC